MDKRFIVVAIAVGTALVSTLLQLFMEGRDVSPRAKRLMWVSLAAGVAALVGLFAFTQ